MKTIQYLIFSLLFVLITSCNKSTTEFNVVLRAYPNPCIDIVSVFLSDPIFMSTEEIKLVLRNGKDEVLEEIRNPNFQQQISIDMRPYEAGIYYFEIQDGAAVISIDKFLKVD